MELSELELSKNNFPVIINYRSATMEVIIPVFAGILLSLMLCAAVSVISGVFRIPVIYEPVAEIAEEEDDEDENPLLALMEETDDTVLKYFRNPEFRLWVINFFTGICSDQEIAQAVLNNSDLFNISPSLAFALCWEESRFNPQAVNRNNRNGSVDRGLFQLNNLSFPNLDSAAFYDINSNTYYGIGHLQYCLNLGGSEVSALAMYNAGASRVRSTGAPEVTLNYISRILETRSRIENQFNEKLIKEEERRLIEMLSDKMFSGEMFSSE